MNQNRRYRSSYLCSFCGKGQDQVQRLIAGPGGAYICNESVASIAQGEYKACIERGVRCSFCGKTWDQVTPVPSMRSPQLITSGYGGIAICVECVELCQAIFKEEHELVQHCKDKEEHELVQHCEEMEKADKA